ncbi:hypothetical protein BO82DRAFT_435687 [Aspergillus uvarum CBS 121591]|uniref:Uncharacterized protein n=1 Tax=Aspergillus uvarum CBS 121591 TaxID=1448315 RepID=A0A319BXW2_9EURO|nr:hypothetical protein BO82DRAFT_435687 [Aspergillus uvarum CBS 121591]PYH77565.1 hypothetical protein BO82DRAFT_435687 [Aspergillus uvarum CBS 121591]
MRFCSMVCAVSLSASIQFLISVFVTILVSIIWNRRHHPRIPHPEIASLPTPVPASCLETSSNPSQPEQPNQEEAEETENEEVYPIVRLPYSEDTIVALLSDIYRIYVQLGYMNNRADGMEELAWPPPEGHSINEAICEELNLSPKVISLMRRLPYPVSIGIAANIPFMPRSTAFVYIDDRQIRDGRDPGRWTFDRPRKDFLLPHEIALACSDDEGIHLVLDTEENTIRESDWQDLEDEDGNADFRGLPAQHAPTFLTEYIHKLRSLEEIPVGEYNGRYFYHVEYDKACPMVKKVLQEQFGWPYDFRETEWKAVAKDTLKRLGQLNP